MKKLGVILLGLVMSAGVAVGQEKADSAVAEKTGATNGDNGYNPLSVRPIHVSDIMWKKTLIRAVDLREKQNKPLFSKNREITRLLIDAVAKGDITPYANDSLDRKITIDEFNEAIKIPIEGGEMTAEEKEIALANGDSSVLQTGGPSYYFPTDIYQMEIKEDLIFDKQRSRLYYDIIAITIFVPADQPQNVKGIQQVIASFSYKELVEKLFKDNPKAIWFNVQNDQQHKNLADAFDLRLFSSYIIKVSNPNDSYLVDIYGGDQVKGIMSSQWAAMELLEFEHNLWEF
ncbi:MAG TPA: gliding motility protein GldN [Cytophagaceae bacterium]|jgi:gliding motility associated protien GldN|nr:gliding motility protein GldN [Cytophagaceae bacterium]